MSDSHKLSLMDGAWDRRQFLGVSLAAGSSAAHAASTPMGPQGVSGKLRAGAATVNITPPLGCSLAGWMYDRIATDVHDDLHVRSLVLDNGRAHIAIAVVDSCMVPRDILDPAKELIRQHTGIPVTHILISATHTHSAPAASHVFQSIPDPKYTQWLTVRIADCVRIAANRLQPARIGWGTGREERLAFNRRYFMKPGTIRPDPFGGTNDRVQMEPPQGSPNIIKPAGPTDPEVSVLAVESLDGHPICVLGNYALHYVSADEAPTTISADYYGAWADSMKRLAGTQANGYPKLVPILSNACSGNIDPMNYMTKPVAHTPYGMVQEYADTLAAECYRIWRTIQYHQDVELEAAVEELELGVRFPSADDASAARRVLAAAPTKILNAEPTGGEYKALSQVYARETVIMSETFTQAVKTPIQALRIGSLGIATFPGEAFVELGLEVKAKSPFRPTMLIELANDYRGYIPNRGAFDLGGYETWRAKSSYLKEQAAPKMVATVLHLLGKLAS